MRILWLIPCLLLPGPSVSGAPSRTVSQAHRPGFSPAASSPTQNSGLMAGASARIITPFEYETWNDADRDATYEPPEDTFNDAGVDHLFDWQEPAALGTDGKPGKADWDDDGNGVTDDLSEYLAPGSDDLPDVNGDNYDATAHPSGTEGNGAFESVALAGFQGFMGEEIRPMQGVHDHLYTRALVLTDGGTSTLLIVNDLIGLLYHYINPVKRDLEDALGVPFDNIIIASTHTHQGPDTIGLWAGDVNNRYIEWVMEQMYAVAVEAWERRQEVDVRSGTAHPVACYDRETLVQYNLPDCTLADYEQANLENTSGTDQYMLQNDLRDPWVRRMEVPAQQFVAKNGATVATVVNFDDHPEVLLDENPYVSSDFPHYVRVALEETFGGTAIYVSGTVGSQMGALRGAPIPLRTETGAPVYQLGIYDQEGNPVPEWAQGPEDRTRSLGWVIGDHAAQSLWDAPFNDAPILSIHTTYIDQTIDNPLYRILMRIIKYTEEFNEWRYLIHAPYCSPVGCVRFPMSVMTVGSSTYVTAPGEFPPEYVVGREASVAPYSTTDPPYPDYAFPALPGIRRWVPTPELFWIGLANQYLGYAIPKADTLNFFDQDHPNYYEEIYDPNLCFGDSVGNRLMEMLGSPERFSDCIAYPE